MGLDFALGAFVTLFAIINPIANVPIIEEITGGFTKDLKKRVVLNIVMVMIVTLLTFGLLGNWIFSVYGITIHTFKVAGGVLLFYISFSMVQGEWSRTKISKEERERSSPWNSWVSYPWVFHCTLDRGLSPR